MVPGPICVAVVHPSLAVGCSMREGDVARLGLSKGVDHRLRSAPPTLNSSLSTACCGFATPVRVSLGGGWREMAHAVYCGF